MTSGTIRIVTRAKAEFIKRGAKGMVARSREESRDWALQLENEDGEPVVFEMDEETAQDVKKRLNHWLD